MPALQVRDLPNDLYERLKECAANDRRSISQQTVIILQDYLDARERTAQKRPDAESAFRNVDGSFDNVALRAAKRARTHQEVFDLIDQLPDLDVPNVFPDIVTLIHEERAQR